MKKQVLIALAALLLSGCAAEETFETISDDLAQPVMAENRKISLNLPPEAASPALEDGANCVYLCGDYEVYCQTLSGGDLPATIRTVSGYDMEDLTVLKSTQEGYQRYDLVWASAGEQGDRVGKACILDDGAYHYVLTVMGNADTAWSHQEQWQAVLDSFSLS